MKLVIQYVTSASVTVNKRRIGKINRGYAVLVGIGEDDTSKTLNEMADKLLKLRTIPNKNGKINLSIQDIGGEMLLIPQFTLYANTAKGHRPSFAEAMVPKEAKSLFLEFATSLKESGLKIETGEFGALMDVTLTNSGPITIILEG